MAEAQQKRPREDESVEFDKSSSNSKRQKPYNNIISLLDEDEDEEQNHDLSAIFSTLEQEISSYAAFDFDYAPPETQEDRTISDGASSSDSCSQSDGDGDDEDDSVKSFMRHLLEASDDELGIPSTDDYDYFAEISNDGNFPFSVVDNGLWELEDAAANYYAVLQSELFIF